MRHYAIAWLWIVGIISTIYLLLHLLSTHRTLAAVLSFITACCLGIIIETDRPYEGVRQ